MAASSLRLVRIGIAELDGEMYCKRLVLRRGRTFLVPANQNFTETDVTDREDFRVWGVVAHAINSFRATQPQKQAGRQRTKKKPV